MVSGEKQDRQRTAGTSTGRKGHAEAARNQPCRRGLGSGPRAGAGTLPRSSSPGGGGGMFCCHSPSGRRLMVTILLQLRMSVSEHNQPKDYLVNTFNYMIIIIQFPLFNILYKTSYNTHISNATIHTKLYRYAKFTRHYEAVS